MRVEWSARSLNDREHLYRYLAAETGGLTVPNQIDGAIEDSKVLLSDFPNAGRIGRMPGTRELLVTGTPYLLVYRVTTPAVWILRVIHQARRWPPKRS